MNSEQKHLFEMLVKLDKFLKKHNIDYYIDGGTLIGAIRNRGFLPWDDDVDTVMTRANYEKLLKVADELYDEGMDLACYERYNDYTKNSVKVIDLTTTMILYGDIVHRRAAGLQVDIFIFDPVPKEKIHEYTQYFSVYTELLTYNYLQNEKIVYNIPLYKKYRRLMRILGRDKVLKILRDKLFCYTEDESDYYILRYSEPDLFYDKRILQEPKYAEFEHYVFPIPTRSEDFLRNMYDDAWAIIPEDVDQIQHNDIRDFDVSGNNYFDDLYSFMDLRKARKVFNIRKKYSIKRLPHKLEKEKYEAGFKVLQMECELKETLPPHKLKRLAEDKKYHEIECCLENMCRHRKLIEKAGILPDFGEEYYRMLIYSLICCGKYYYAETILLVAENYYNVKFEELKMLINTCRELSVLLDNREYDSAEDIISKKWDIYWDVVDFVKGKILIENMKSKFSEVCNSDLIRKAMKLHESDGELIKLYGDAVKMVYNEEEAMKYYKEAVTKTRNGMVLLELKELYGLNTK